MVPGQTAHQQAAGRHDGGDDLLADYPVNYAINTMSS
jgi:hypothetical protein